VIPAYGTANARLTFATLEDGWSLALAGTNIFNARYYYNKNYVSGNFQIKGNPAPGAEWSLSLKKTF
jgi:outer membrane receptor protein involved in Fe transport